MTSLNIYRHNFTAVCPSDAEVILYSLEIRSKAMIRVEHIKTATALIKQGWHEQIADDLAEQSQADHAHGWERGAAVGRTADN